MNHAVNWEAISAIGQIVGALAVVISLIYLAREVRRNARETRRASMHSLSDKFNRRSQQLAEQPHPSDLDYRGIHDFAPLERAELVRFTIVMSQLFRNYEDAYYGELGGHLDARVWHSWEAAMRDINAYPGVQAWWRSRSRWFSEEEFANYINQLQQTAGPPT